MSKSTNVQQEQNQNVKEAAEIQNKAIREFVEEKAGDSRTKGPVDESTARLPDDQNRLITQHNLRK
ncbi:hypothetical protein QW71_31290 [Paenibacillus sp. IHB B 3415]|uniref:hypothetical protein n=1 Tax=Paenibacillus sp. IHB B 3415 TaxID=867080 RepID=UPI000574F555|nr:hypothetical protein [Paenibacillus sp. IHB B 3415]KHL92058.1 hypothetical protein QW71_31290 [Paenibacillus sp. IHB B 3415]